MAQLKIKQISDFVTGVGTIHDATVGTATVTAISTAKSEAISTASADATSKADTAEANAVATASADATSKADTAEANAVATAAADATSKANTAESNANSYTDGREVVIRKDFADADVLILNAAKSHSDIQKGRLDALLSDSDGALDTFVEIENFIKNLSTADINGLIQDIADAESDAVATANTYTDGEIATLDSRIDGLEGAAFEEVLAKFGDATSFSTPGVQFDLGNVKVFVNGLQIHEAGEGVDGWSSADGTAFTVSGLGYVLEGDDHIIVSGKLQ